VESGDTNRKVLTNRPGVIIEKRHKVCLLMEGAVPLDRDVIKKEAENKLKYMNLST
jgi:hypothetical protein